MLCHLCGARYAIINGIPCIEGKDNEQIWEFTNEKNAKDVLENAITKGWEDAIRTQFGKKKSEWIASESRAEALFLTNIGNNSVVLDAGTGWGALAFPMAKIAKEVYAIDSNINGLNFIQLRRSQDGNTNVIPIKCDISNLPFENESIDIAILNGVLEWTPLSRTNLKPFEVQKKILSELNRVLKRNGQIFIGIENRFGLRYLLGKPDEHTHLRFITVLPRFVANLYHRFRRKTDYRTHTHSNMGIIKLMNLSGFPKTDIYSVLPDYRFYKYIVPLDGPSSRKTFGIFLSMLKHKSITSIKYRFYYHFFRIGGLPSLRLFSNAYIAIGTKDV